MNLYLTRHGKVHNPNHILYGRLPRFGLSEQGKKEAQELCLSFKNKNISALYTSPLLRARQTAEIIGNELGLKPSINKNLIETDMLLQGRPGYEFDEKEPVIYTPE